jgi:hypothetical protein
MKPSHVPPATPPFSARCGSAILLLAASLFLGGCTAIDKIKAPSLNGDPSKVAVVVVKFESTWQGLLSITKTSQHPVKGLIDGEAAQTIGRGVADLIIFPNVPPGECKLAAVELTRNMPNGQVWQMYAIPRESVKDYTFSVKAGEVKYLGVVTVVEKQNPKRTVDIGLQPGKEAEIAAWEKFVTLYPGSSWANAAQKRIAELKQ